MKKRCRQEKPRNAARALGLVLMIAALFALTGTAATNAPTSSADGSWIVQAESLAAAVGAVHSVGGDVERELGIIHAVSTTLSGNQMLALTARSGVRIYPNSVARSAVKSSKGDTPPPDSGSGKALDTQYPTVIGADDAHRNGVLGKRVTIAVLDTGIAWYPGTMRILGSYDAFRGLFTKYPNNDGSGHGTHVSSVAMSNRQTHTGLYSGIAPAAELLSVKAFDSEGRGTYADVIAGLDWIVANRDYFHVRVVNLSFSAKPSSYYWDDPLNQAVMRAWQAGLVVVASAGNSGPHPMTIGVPGNVPYIITVGAMSDGVTSADNDDFLTSFSSAGPTVEGFVKPELVAPGGHMLGIMMKYQQLPTSHPQYHFEEDYFTMSGTSQAAAVVSGAAALLLERQPYLSPDDVKCRLMASARPALNRKKQPAYSIFQQGAGMVHAYDALFSTTAGCANRGLDIDADLAGIQHFGGRANRAKDGTYYLEGLDGSGYTWSDGYAWSDGYIWSDGYAWSDGYTWSDGYAWSDGYTWSDSYDWSDVTTKGYTWNDSKAAHHPAGGTLSIPAWVAQE